jgi:hypothetical protein
MTTLEAAIPLHVPAAPGRMAARDSAASISLADASGATHTDHRAAERVPASTRFGGDPPRTLTGESP